MESYFFFRCLGAYGGGLYIGAGNALFDEEGTNRPGDIVAQARQIYKIYLVSSFKARGLVYVIRPITISRMFRSLQK